MTNEPSSKKETASGLYDRREERPPVLRARPSRMLRRSAGPEFRHGAHTHRHEVRQMAVIGLAVVVLAALFLGRGMLKRALSSLGAIGERPGAPAASGPPASRVAVRDLISGAHAAADVLTEVDQLMGRGMAAESVARLNRQLRITPTSHALKLELARIYRQQADFAEAESILAEILEAQPQHLRARIEMALLALEAKRNADAHEIARWILEDNPAHPEALRIAAESCMNAGWYQAAQGYLRPLMDVDPGRSDVREMMGLACLRLQQHAKAIMYLTETLKISGHSPLVYFHIAAAYARQQQSKDAVDALVIAAQRYGNDRVVPWLGSADFDTIKEDALFLALRAQLTQPAATDTAGRNPGSSPGEVNAHLAPEPLIDSTKASDMLNEKR